MQPRPVVFISTIGHAGRSAQDEGMKQALERIDKAMAAGEKIVVYGDYDADGVCSIVNLMECFERMGYLVDYYVPNRFSEAMV